ncbi:MAG: outer membrane lipoprotein carrier protein LolA [Spirochaetaceae bacterium]|jgi:outer membrane lipoprotein-sorting protein|nr:outer membrane lipoprotein carrier protein LolA [Spirochaetaceae bacterium]
MILPCPALCKRILLCGILTLIPALLWTQTARDDVFNHPLNGETRPHFTAICAAMAEHRLMRGNFVQTKTLKRLGRSLVSQGNFVVDAGLGIIWDTRSPYPSVMAVGRDFVVQSSGGRTTRLDTADNAAFVRISETMGAVFTGDIQKLTGNFEVFFTGQQKNWALGLVPKDSVIRSFARAIVITGDSAVRTVTLYEQNGDTVVYELSDHSYPSALSSNERAYFSVP